MRSSSTEIAIQMVGDRIQPLKIYMKLGNLAQPSNAEESVQGFSYKDNSNVSG